MKSSLSFLPTHCLDSLVTADAVTTWTKDEFAAANIPCQLQERHRASQSSEDGDWAPAAAVGEGEGQAPERLPSVVEQGGFQRAGDGPHFVSTYLCDNST